MRIVKSNIQKLVESAIEVVFAGKMGPAANCMAGRELIHNGGDAGATEVKIWAQTGNIYFHDNGKGFSESSQHSWLSFGFSDKDETDFDIAGQHGTGGKGFLALLSKLKKHACQINVTTTTDGKRFDSFDISIKHLVDITTKPVDLKGLVKSVKKPSNWSKDIITGSLITITTGNQNTAKSIVATFKTDLNSYLMPSSIKKVVIDGEKLVHVIPDYVKVYNDTTSLTLLGKVSVEIYPGYNPTGMGIWLCGVNDTIIPLKNVFDDNSLVKLNREQRTMVNAIIACGGYISIGSMKRFRKSGNVLSDEFYSDGFIDELLAYLDIISPNIKSLREVIKTDKVLLDTNREMGQLARVTLEKNPYNGGPGGVGETRKAFAQKVYDEEDILILPKKLNLVSERVKSVTLNNVGRVKVDFSTATWYCEDTAIATISGSGETVDIIAGEVGETKIIVSYRNSEEILTHTINIVVEAYSKQVYIEGPSTVFPSSSGVYVLKNCDAKVVSWALSGSDVTFQEDGLSVSVNFGPAAKKCLIRAMDESGAILASKNVKVSDTSTAGNPIIFSIGGEHYEFQVNLALDTLASKLPAKLSASGLPLVGINPLHPMMSEGAWAPAFLIVKLKMLIVSVLSPDMHLKHGDLAPKVLFEFLTKI